MYGASQSLNVSVSVAVSLHVATEARRRLLGRAGDLDEDELVRLRARYYWSDVREPQLVVGHPRDHVRVADEPHAFRGECVAVKIIDGEREVQLAELDALGGGGVEFVRAAVLRHRAAQRGLPADDGSVPIYSSFPKRI